MTIVIPMAGRGQRFIEAGYKLPKMLLQAHGKSLLQWSVDSLPVSECARLVFIGLEEHERYFNLSERIRAWYSKVAHIDFYFLSTVTGGQAETVLAAQPSIPREEPLLIFNIDTAFRSPTLVSALRGANDGVLGSFSSTEPRYSFAALDPAGLVARVTEKEPISHHALTGLYHFRRASDFLDVAVDAVARNKRVKGEFYVAPLYNPLIARGGRYVVDSCLHHFILGTPAEYEFFLSQPTDTILEALQS